MGKFLKVLGVIIISLILLFITAIVLLTQLVNPNDYKQHISQFVQDETHRTLSINGDISWSFFPWLGFQINDVTLSNPKGFNGTNFLKLKAAEVNVRIIPLFSGRVQIGKIILDNLHVNLITNKRGETNWQVPKKDKKKKSKQTIASTKKQDALFGLGVFVSGVDIRDGQIHWLNQKTGEQLSITNIDLDSKNIGLNKPFNLHFNATIHDKKQLNLPISVATTLKIDDRFQNVAIDKLILKIHNLTVQGDLNARNLFIKPQINGKLNVPQFNLKRLFKSINNINLKTAKKNALSKASAHFNFTADENQFNIPALKVNLDQSTINGSLSINNFSKPAIRFKLNANQLNFDNYLAPIIKKGKGGSRQLNKTTTKNSVNIGLPINTLRDLNVAGSLNLQQLTAFGLQTSNNTAAISAKNGILKITSLKANLYQGSANADFSLNAQKKIPRITINTNVAHVQIKPLLTALKNITFLSGTGNFKLNLTTQGNTTNALLQGLNGTSNLALENGVIQGINVEYEIAKAQALIKQQIPPTKPLRNETPFAEISGSANVQRGIAYNNDLIVKTLIFKAKGKGSINFPQTTLNYKIGINPLKAGDLNNYTLPLVITGPLTKPNISLDFQDIVKQVITKEAAKHVKKEIQKHVGKELEKHIDKSLGDQIGKEIGKQLGGLFG